MGHFFAGDFAALFASVREEVEAAIATIECDQIPSNLERVVHLLGYYAMGNAQLGNFLEARSLANTAAGIAKHSSNIAIGMFSEFYRQYVLTHQGEINNAILNLIRVLRNGRHHSRSLETGLLVCHLGFIYQIVGKISLSIEVSERIYGELPANETGILQAYLETSLTSAYTLAGDLSRAKTFARRSLETAEGGGFRSVMVWSLRNQGILAQLHSVDGLSGTIEDAFELASELKMQPDLAHLLRIRSGLERRKGNASTAATLLDQAHSLYANMGMNRWLDYHPESQFGT
jgi:ATP/maltotriose-dependent transcriptional regulator MalT